jgi:hypothetical protein
VPSASWPWTTRSGGPNRPKQSLHRRVPEAWFGDGKSSRPFSLAWVFACPNSLNSPLGCSVEVPVAVGLAELRAAVAGNSPSRFSAVASDRVWHLSLPQRISNFYFRLRDYHAKSLSLLRDSQLSRYHFALH